LTNELLFSDLTGALVGFILTIFIFSYLIGDNALFRSAIHIFIGAAAGYTAVVIWQNVLLSQLIQPLIAWNGSLIDRTSLVIALVLSVLLLFKIYPRTSSIGTPIMAFLVGIGAATAIGGAVVGTLLPQVSASINLFDPIAQNTNRDPLWTLLIESGFVLLATLSTLIYFHFGARPGADGIPKRATWIEMIADIGKFFIAITFGALFAGVLLSAISAFVARWNLIILFLTSLINF